MSSHSELATVDRQTGEIVMQASAGALSATAEAERSRMIAEIQARVIVAQQNPRNELQSIERVKLAFTRPRLAAAGMYAYPRGGEQISGLSIRAAEAIALSWRNIAFGTRELERNIQAHTSLALSYAWDLEANVLSELSFEIAHVRDSRGGGKKIVTEERDIYEVVANLGSRRKRACILGIVPFDVKEEAEDQIDETMKANVDIKPETIAKLLAGFTKFGVSKEAIAKRLQRKIESITPAQVIHLRRIWASLNDGMSEPSEWFELEPTIDVTASASKTKTQTIADDLAAKAASAAAAAEEAKAAATIAAAEAEASKDEAPSTAAPVIDPEPAAQVQEKTASDDTSLLDRVTAASAGRIKESQMNLAIRAHAADGLTNENVEAVLAEVEKLARKPK